MAPGTMPPNVAFTRASTATYFDATGTMQTAAVNAPRWDYTGGTLRGLLIEEARTNVLLNTATLGTQSVAVTAQAYMLSFYGTGTITKSGTATGALVGTGVGQRVSQTFTPTAGTLTLTVTGTVTNAQLEAGAFVTSYIPVAGAAATRAIDMCGISPANMSWLVPTSSSWFAEFINFNPSPPGPGPRIIAYPSAGVGSPLYLNNTLTLVQFDGIAAMQTVNVATPNAITRGGSTWATGGTGTVALNGGAIASAGGLTNGFGFFASSGLQFMTNGVATENMSGYMRRVRYWPRALSNAELQSVTT
jgi:hypothetical protein